MLNRFWVKCHQLLLPATCTLCSMPAEQLRDLCNNCKARFPKVINPCYKCGKPLPKTNTTLNCGSCSRNIWYFDKTISLLAYQEPIDYLIKRIKFGFDLASIKVLGDLFAEYLDDYYQYKAKPQAIIPVPLHQKRIIKRGFNQALELGRPIAKKLRIPLIPNCCSRSKNTHPQAELETSKRKKNIKNAFQITKKIKFKHIAIMDDVITTGMTINELAQCFKKQGVEVIEVWSIARSV